MDDKGELATGTASSNIHRSRLEWRVDDQARNASSAAIGRASQSVT